MAGGGKVKIKGGVASHSEALVIDGALLVTDVGGAGAANAGRFQMNFYGEDLGSGVTSVELMGANTALGIPFARAVETANVAVRLQRLGVGPIGPWTARLFRNDVLVATFSVATS